MSKIKFTDLYFSALKNKFYNEVILPFISNDAFSYEHEVKDIVYHYTSLDTLINIINNQTLWATNHRFLNDRSEYKHGISLLLEFIETQKPSKNLYLKTLIPEFEKIGEYDRYVTCFSNNGDLLSQWRAYSNNGKGVSIGFIRTHINSALAKPTDGSYILYDDLKKNIVLQTYLEKWLAFSKKEELNFDWQNHDPKKVFNLLFIDFFSLLIADYKDSAFAEENEYRISLRSIFFEPKYLVEPKFRTNGSLIIPYIELETKYNEYKKAKEQYGTITTEKLPIVEIIIGPSLDFPAVFDGLTLLLNANQYEGVEIKPSEIPYRI